MLFNFCFRVCKGCKSIMELYVVFSLFFLFFICIFVYYSYTVTDGQHRLAVAYLAACHHRWHNFVKVADN